MLDLSGAVKRYFSVKLPHGEVLELKPPKVKVLRRVTDVADRFSEDSMEREESFFKEFAEAVALILSSNKKGKKFDANYVEDNIELDAAILLFEGYFKWVGEVQKDPN